MLINLSNHPFDNWSKEQKEAALNQFEAVRDIPFPNVPPEWDTTQVEMFAREYYEEIKLITKEIGEKPVIHIAGEPVFCFLLIQMLLNEKFSCITATTGRIVKEENNVKTTIFEFKRFRNYSYYGK